MRLSLTSHTGVSACHKISVQLHIYLLNTCRVFLEIKDPLGRWAQLAPRDQMGPLDPLDHVETVEMMELLV